VLLQALRYWIADLLSRKNREPISDDLLEEADDGPQRERVEHFVHPDGAQRITIYRRPDGLYEYGPEAFYVTDIPEYEVHLEYWASIGDDSGLFDSIETAKRDAAVLYPWVNDTQTPERN
jgi:hypothetical protein